MNPPKRKLTESDWVTLASALNRAMDERASYADAWQDGRARRAALAQVKKYEALHRKIFGGPSSRQTDLDALAACPTVSIFDMKGG